MKKLILLSFLLLPVEALAQEDLAQVVFRRTIHNEYDDSSVSGKFFDPKFKAQLVFDLNADSNYSATESKNEYENIYSRARAAAKFSINKSLSVGGVLRLRQLQNPSEGSALSEGKNRFFKNESLYLQELTVNFDQKNYSLLAGKFTQNFGTAWRWGRGIWSNDLAKAYREIEKIGVGGVYKVGDSRKTGRYVFGFSTFTNDRKNLDNSVITERDSDSKSAAKAGDTRSLKSYTASADVSFDFAPKEKLTYHFSYTDMAVNSRYTSVPANKLGDEKGYAVAMDYRYPINENFLLDTLLEYVKLKNIDGNSDVSDQYSTFNFVAEIYKNWNITAATTMLARQQYGQNGYDRSLSEISFGYNFDKNDFFDKLILQLGYKNYHTNYKTYVDDTNSLGVMLRYFKSI